MTTTTYEQESAVFEAKFGPKGWPLSLPLQSALQESVHEPHWQEREKIILALVDSYMPSHKRRSERLAGCCQGASFFIDPDLGKVRPWINRCRDRLCPYCAKSRSAHVAGQLLDAMMEMTRPRVIVLTVKSVELPLGEQLANLRNHLAKIRRLPFWKTAVAGGVYVLEITRNPKTGLWHPHIHVIYDGDYIPQRLLRRHWHDVTGSAEIVWIQAVDDRKGMAREMAKYIGKPQDVMKLPPYAIREYADAVHGSRMVQTFGNLHGRKVEDRDVKDRDKPSQYTVKISRLVHLAHKGLTTPQKLLVLIADRWPQFRSYIYHQLPRLERPPNAGDQMRRLQKLLGKRGPPARAPPEKKDHDEKLDTAIFSSFTRFRQEEKQNLYEELDYHDDRAFS